MAFFFNSMEMSFFLCCFNLSDIANDSPYIVSSPLVVFFCMVYNFFLGSLHLLHSNGLSQLQIYFSKMFV